MRSDTLVFAAFVLASPSLAAPWYSEYPVESYPVETPSYSLSKTESRHEYPSVTYPAYPTSTPEVVTTRSPLPTSTTEEVVTTRSPFPTSTPEEVSTTRSPTETPPVETTRSPTSSPAGQVPTTYSTITYHNTTIVTYSAAPTSPAETPATTPPTYVAPVPTSGTEGVPTYAPAPPAYTNGTVTSTNGGLSPSAAPTSNPSGTVPISGAGRVGVGSVVFGAVLGLGLALL